METISQTTCRNCDSRLIPAAHFCSHCGQSAAPVRTTTLEIFHDWSEHYIGSHGALWRTLFTLLKSPGKLTRDYIAGKRTMYLKPIQLYFLASILMFSFVGFGGIGKLNFVIDGEKEPINASADLGEWVNKLIPNLAGKIESRVKTINEMPRSELALRVNAFTSKFIPIGLFLLVPILAFFLKALWGWRIRYADHFVFTLHAQATVFFFLAVFYIGPKEFGAYHGIVAAVMLWTIWRAFALTYGGGVMKRALLLIPTVFVYFAALILVIAAIVVLAIALG
jgi:Protein of unknown function (DUF3667)